MRPEDEIVARVLEEVAARTCDTAEDTRWALNQRAQNIRGNAARTPSPPSQSKGLELYSPKNDPFDQRAVTYERNTAAERVCELAERVCRGEADHGVLWDALMELKGRGGR